MIERSTLKSFKQGVARGPGIGIGISIALATTTLLAAAAAMKVFSAGEVISATELNHNFTIAAPEGAVIAFHLSTCPEGWVPADGTGGTPNLRGRFIRGMNDFGTGTDAADPDGATRAIGSEQLDAFQGHWHSAENTDGSGYYPGGTFFQTPGSGTFTNNRVRDAVPDTSGIAPRTATETRPRNVALIYCMRKN